MKLIDGIQRGTKYQIMFGCAYSKNLALTHLLLSTGTAAASHPSLPAQRWHESTLSHLRQRLRGPCPLLPRQCLRSPCPPLVTRGASTPASASSNFGVSTRLCGGAREATARGAVQGWSSTTRWRMGGTAKGGGRGSWGRETEDERCRGGRRHANGWAAQLARRKGRCERDGEMRGTTILKNTEGQGRNRGTLCLQR
uniref:Uncharacterized protein n=1 Tax=Setaria viridis TaxID=4556 RepID=A0A4U6UN55_SETVI|nr:hypothetical protein SEVIR_5G399250v2 [Setaria viridis]